jgi:predicted ATPase
VAALADDLGMAALRGRGSELELDLPFTVVRQLFEGRIARAGPDERARILGGAAALATTALHLGGPTVHTADPFTVTHALYWLCANLAELQPLLLVVDDVHWADVQSLRWLAYMRARLEDLPVAFVAAARPAAAGAPVELLRIALPGSSAAVLRPGALSRDGATAFLQAQLVNADVAFCTACALATGGNPFLLSELVGAVRSQGIAPTADAAGLVAQLISPGVSRSVLQRLGPLGTDALGVGHALAVLGPGNNLARAARLAQVSLPAAAMASDRLRQASILRPDDSLDFLHPLLRSAVYSDIAPAARRALHRRAAEILADDGVGVEQVASHLLGSEPAGDPWVVDRLLEAAHRSLSAGAPDAAARYLARAVEEPPARLSGPRCCIGSGWRR